MRLDARDDLGVPAREHQAGRDRLGVDAVRAADHRRLRVLARALGERRARGPSTPSEDLLERARRSGSRAQVSSTSDDVMPRCSQRAGSPASSSTWVRNAMTSWRVVASISRMRAGSSLPAAAARTVSRGARGHGAGASPSPRTRRARSRATARSDTCRPTAPRARVDCSEGSSRPSAHLVPTGQASSVDGATMAPIPGWAPERARSIAGGARCPAQASPARRSRQSPGRYRGAAARSGPRPRPAASSSRPRGSGRCAVRARAGCLPRCSSAGCGTRPGSSALSA